MAKRKSNWLTRAPKDSSRKSAKACEYEIWVNTEKPFKDKILGTSYVWVTAERVCPDVLVKAYRFHALCRGVRLEPGQGPVEIDPPVLVKRKGQQGD